MRLLSDYKVKCTKENNQPNMASPTVPNKSQPLHNFTSLSCLKWNSHPRNQRSSAAARRSSSPHQSAPLDDSPQQQSPLSNLASSQHGDLPTDPLSLPSPPLQSPISGGCSDGSIYPPPSSLLSGPSNDEVAQPQSLSPVRGGAAAIESNSSSRNEKTLIEYRRQSRNSVPRTEKIGVSPPNRSVSPQNFEDQCEEPVSGNQEGKRATRSSRIRIKLTSKEKNDSGEIKAHEELKIDNSEIQEDGKQIVAFDDENPVPRTWNFRPRKAKGVIDHIGRVFKNSASAVQEKGVHSSQVNHADVSEAKKEKKKGFTVSLSKEEIEADILAMTGSKPRKRPKKRSKATQEVVDSLLPGSWLQSITPDSYKVPQNRRKA